jgi:hypothetical protein
MKGTIRAISERGVVSIDHELRELKDIKGKEALLRLRGLEVVQIEDDSITVQDLPDETCQTISRINERGTVVVDEEVRELLGIKNKRGMLKIGEIEVAKILGDEPSKVGSGLVSIIEGSVYARSCGQIKAYFLRESPDFKYPPSNSTAAKIVGSWILIAVVAAVLLNSNGALDALASGDLLEWAGLAIAAAVGMLIMMASLPSRRQTVQALLERSEA